MIYQLAWHMGALHGYEKFLVVALAFGPFLVLAVVMWVLRRRDERETEPTVAISPVDRGN